MYGFVRYQLLKYLTINSIGQTHIGYPIAPICLMPATQKAVKMFGAAGLDGRRWRQYNAPPERRCVWRWQTASKKCCVSRRLIQLAVSMSEAVSRRLEILKLEGLGFSEPEIVRQLSSQRHCSERTIYNDFETRSDWQPFLQGAGNPNYILLKIINRYEEIYRQASKRMLTAQNPLVQIAALNTMLKANSLMFDTAVLPQLMAKLKNLEDKVKRGVFVP